MRNVKPVTFALLIVAGWLSLQMPAARAADGSLAQQRAAEELLHALARGDASAMAMAIHEEELVALRSRLLEQMRLEADRGSSLTRVRLFGEGMPLAEIERLTPQSFFVALSQRLSFGGREFRKVDWIAAVKDRGGMVHMVGRLIPPEELGEVRVPVLVTIIPWGKDWKAALPLELQAQIDDLRHGRMRASRMGTAVASAGAGGAGGEAQAPKEVLLPPAMVKLFDEALANLEAGKCSDYYEKQMSPNFRRTTGTRALRTLISACESRPALREQYMAAIRLARQREPRYEYAGTRAVFDLSGSGLPYTQWIVERIDERWYIAE
jgi:hypothetical protein